MWSNVQKQLAVRACKAAGIDDEQRLFILRQFRHAHHDGAITSTSPKLTNQDYAEFMAIAERSAGAGGKLLHFTAGYWRQHAADHLQRMRFRASRLAAVLEGAGKLAPDGIGLAGWIEKRVSAGAARKIEELDYHGLQALILGLQTYSRQCEVTIDPQAPQANQPTSASAASAGQACLFKGEGP